MTRGVPFLFLLLLTANPTPALSSDARTDEIDRALRAFESSTRAFMSTIPEKIPYGGNPRSTPHVRDQTEKYALINRQIDRLERAGSGAPFDSRAGVLLRFPVGSHDNARDLVDRLEHETLSGMDSAGLTSAALREQPWSGSYWPIAKGVLAWRFADPAFPQGGDWKAIADFVEDQRNSSSVAQLSPAEKYDLLVGDASQTLTRAMLSDGRGYYVSTGTVEPWMGICHGWAPAAYMAPRPAKTTEAVASDGRTRIPFSPSDIKGLVSLLWANGRFANRFIGLRCHDKNPPTDEYGRITDPACYGENPGTWHLSVVNQIGVSRRSFVMDAQHDTEIWNQPIHGYSYTYFNPQSRRAVASIEEARVSPRDFADDKFKRYRSAEARSIVGIAMDLTYVAETEPTSAPADSPAADALVKVRYLYDLELTEDGRILGGEWYTHAHPGFLWTPAVGARPNSQSDLALDRADPGSAWGVVGPIPAGWSAYARRAAREGQPLRRIVEALDLASAL